MPRIIEVTVSPRGETTVQTKGYTGGDCLQASKFLEQALGVTASDIENYALPSDALTDQDVKALQAELTDPRFGTAEWRAEIDLMLKNGKKAEQQSLAKYGLNYVTEKYLPEKLTEMGVL